MIEKSTPKNQPHPHPGSGNPGKTAPGDFGVPETDVVERSYTSENTKRADPGGAPARSTPGGTRTSGAGGNDSGLGSSSGGDLDPDIIGFGKGAQMGGVAASGKIHDPPGPDDATGTSRDFASGPPAAPNRKPATTDKVQGSTVQPPDDRTAAPAGADAASRPDGNNAFAGEVSSGEASGRDQAGQ